MKKFLVAGVMSSLAFASLSAKELELENLSANWQGPVSDFQVVEGKGIDGGSAVEFVAQDKYKKVMCKDKFSVEEGKRMTATVDFKADMEGDAKNKTFLAMIITPSSNKADERILLTMANGKKGYVAAGFLPRWTQKFISPKKLGISSNVGSTPWLRAVVSIENQKKKIASKMTIYSLGVDGTSEPTVVHETKMKRKTKKGNWKSNTDWTFAFGSGEINQANAKEVVISKIDVKVQDI